MDEGDRMLLYGIKQRDIRSRQPLKLMQIRRDEIERGIRFVCVGIYIAYTERWDRARISVTKVIYLQERRRVITLPYY